MSTVQHDLLVLCAYWGGPVIMINHKLSWLLHEFNLQLLNNKIIIAV